MIPLTTLALFLSPRVAYANGPIPPVRWWFTFDYGTDEGALKRLEFEGLQVIGCETPDCEQPVLLQQFGDCRAPECLSSEPILEPGPYKANRITCAEGRCYFPNYHGPRYEGDSTLPVKLVAQFSDQARVSNVVQVPSGIGPGDTVEWQVSVRAQALVLALDEREGEDGPAEELGWPSFLYGASGLVLSQIAEIGAALLCLCLLFRPRDEKCGWRRVGEIALMVFAINLVTYPIAWLFFPSLGKLQPLPTRTMGLVALVLALLYGILLVVIYRVRGKRRLGLSIATLVSLPLAVACGTLLWGYVSYGAGYQVAAMGLPAAVIVPLAEGFAVVAEALLLTLLHKGRLPFWKAGVTGVLMNAASFFLGVLVFGMWP